MAYQELCHRPQGKTVLHVVGRECVLERWRASSLPLPPPHDTLQAGRLYGCPATAHILPDVLPTVGVGGKIDVGIDDGEHIHQT